MTESPPPWNVDSSSESGGGVVSAFRHPGTGGKCHAVLARGRRAELRCLHGDHRVRRRCPGLPALALRGRDVPRARRGPGGVAVGNRMRPFPGKTKNVRSIELLVNGTAGETVLELH